MDYRLPKLEVLSFEALNFTWTEEQRGE